MIQIRKSQDRGHADHGWLKAKHSFSFADYYDPQNMGFSLLRVINEDRISAGNGFGVHPHRDMEIITYIISGALEHKDSMGNSAVIKPGEVQTMSAGTGVRHSEYNPRDDQETHLLQIWIEPKDMGIKPNYGQRSYEKLIAERDLVLVVSGDGREGSIRMNLDANLYASKLKAKKKIDFKLDPNRSAWLQLITGELDLNSKLLKSGDGAAIKSESSLEVTATSDAHFLLFELP